MPWSRKRAFFFVSYQATRDVNAASLASSVRSLSLPPIPAVRTPASLGAIFGGRTGLFGGVAIAPDGSNINPVALNLLNARNPDGSLVIPSPQIAGSGVNYTAVLPGRYDEDQFNTNVDLNLGRPIDCRQSSSFRTRIRMCRSQGPLCPGSRPFVTSRTGIWQLRRPTSSPRGPSINSAPASPASPVEALLRDR